MFYNKIYNRKHSTVTVSGPRESCNRLTMASVCKIHRCTCATTCKAIVL